MPARIWSEANVFSRLPSPGALTQLAGRRGCWQDSAFPGGPYGCKRSPRAMRFVLSVTVSPGGRAVYTGAQNGIAIFARRR
jgi:hypothetical protein